MCWFNKQKEMNDSNMSMDIDGKEEELDCDCLRSIVDDPNKYFYSTRKTFPPPPDGLISSRILPDGSNTVVCKTTLSSEEVFFPPPGVSAPPVQQIDPSANPIPPGYHSIYSGKLSFIPQKE